MWPARGGIALRKVPGLFEACETILNSLLDTGIEQTKGFSYFLHMYFLWPSVKNFLCFLFLG